MIYVNERRVEKEWLAGKMLTIFCVNILENSVWSIGTTNREHVEMKVPRGSPLAESLVSAWGVTWCPAGKKMSFETIDRKIVAKLA